LPDYRKIVRSTSAYHEPDPTSPVIFNLEPGQVLEVISEDDTGFSRLTHLGQPVYVRRDDTVHATAEEAALVQPEGAPATPVSGQAGFCPHCGEATASGARYCKRCGGRLAPSDGMAALPAGEPAGFWIRFAGLLIDGIIVTLIAIAIAGGPAAVVGVQDYNEGSPYTTQFEEDEAIDDALNKALIVFYPVYFAVTIAYFTIGFATSGTPAARLLGLRILREDGSNPGLVRGFVRWLVSIISYNVLYLGYLWAIWDDDKQTWHDKAAGTYVVRKSGA
jgi:uncharacterized RDD family membrane protein YckC